LRRSHSFLRRSKSFLTRSHLHRTQSTYFSMQCCDVENTPKHQYLGFTENPGQTVDLA
jgi:hypothetical protein